MRAPLPFLAVLLPLVAFPVGAGAQDADLFERRCELGELSACNVLGLMFETGAGKDEDIRRAIGIYEETCAAGDGIGCTSVGLLYQAGRGTESDLERAAERYRRGCDAEALLACDLLTALEDEGPITERRSFYKAGWVGDDRNAARLQGVLVEIPRLGLQVVSDGDGRVSFGQVPEGTYGLRAEAPGYEEVSGVLNVPGHAELIVLLHRAEWLRGREPGWVTGWVGGAEDTGIPGVEVSVVGQEGTRTSTGPDGSFELTSVEPGLVRLRVSLTGQATRETLVVVQPGRTARVHGTVTVEGIELERYSQF